MTQDTSRFDNVPRHVAVIMDGNGRWAKNRFLPRTAGHAKGVEALRKTIRACAKHGVKFLSVFAFSSENWSRPESEVSFLMDLFIRSLGRETERLHRGNVRLKIAGDTSAFEPKLVEAIRDAEARTAGNDGLLLTVCANYGGRWDMTQAATRAARECPDGAITEDKITERLALAESGDVDLLIRTGGEKRISNFLLWQSAYAELYFTDTYWPDFDEKAFEEALAWFSGRSRRFGGL